MKQQNITSATAEVIEQSHILLALSQCTGIGAKTGNRIIEHVDLALLKGADTAKLMQLGFNSKCAHAFSQTNWQHIEHLYTQTLTNGFHLVSQAHPAYPTQLKQLPDAPLVLFCHGDLALLSQKQIAIVGSRSASPSGQETASQFAYHLSQAGLVVTSGLAAGIDASAHKGALAAHGGTVAVLGTGLDHYYPKRNKLLQQQVAQSGLLISEHLLGTAPHARNFPRRNRIIAGLSQGVLVVEAELKSGSLITADCALDYNREVFAIPSSIHNPLAKGCHQLIKQGAKLTENIEDILTELGVFYQGDSMVKAQPPSSQNALLQHIGYEATPLDSLVAATGLPVEQLLTQLMDLELEGKVFQVPDGYIKQGEG